MKITLTNKTQYRAEDLRALVHGACDAAGARTKRLELTVVYSRSSYVTGYATYPRINGSGEMRIRTPPPAKEIIGGSVAQVCVHEAMHLAGARHPDMTEEQRYCRMATLWADGLQLRVQEPVQKPKPDPELRRAAARAGRLEHAQKMLAKATTRSRRAKTIEAKWKRRVGALSR